MTTDQISYILNKIGSYSLDSWISLSEVGMITFSHDEILFPHSDKNRYKFGSDGILRIAKGTVDSDNNFTDVYGNSDEEKYEVHDFMEMNKISGIIQSVTYVSPSFISRRHL